MLPASARLRSSRDHKAVSRRGRRARRGSVVVATLSPPVEGAAAAADPADRLLPPRVGVVVGRSVGGAVVRSRVKRKLREVLRARLDGLPDGSLTVVRALPGADVPYLQLERWVGAALQALDAGTGGTGPTDARPVADRVKADVR